MAYKTFEEEMNGDDHDNDQLWHFKRQINMKMLKKIMENDTEVVQKMELQSMIRDIQKGLASASASTNEGEHPILGESPRQNNVETEGIFMLEMERTSKK
jgi:hypothetical protein